MLRGIIGLSIRYRGVVLALAVLLAVYGGYRLSQVQYDVFPEFAPPQVQIQTQAPGLAPLQIEQLVTQPLENTIIGVNGVESVRSGSIQGISVITVYFKPGSDIYRDRQLIAERLTTAAGRLPNEAQAPEITPLTSSTSTVLMFGLTSKKQSLMDLYGAAQWTVRRRLLAVPGVADVVVFDRHLPQLQVQVKPNRLVRYGVSLQQVADIASRATGIRGAGFIDTRNQRIQLRTEGQFVTPAALAGTVLKRAHGAIVKLGQVAKVRWAPAPPVGAALIDGRPGVLLIVSAQYGANTVQVTQRLEQALRGLKPALARSGVKLHSDLFRPATFVHTAVGNVKAALAIGAGLVVIVLLLFLFNWRTALISVLAIPLSLLAAIVVLSDLGLSLNTMTLGGLAVSIGLLVDDAVITVENIYRRLAENRRRSTPAPLFVVIRDATFEMRSAVVYATLAVALVFLPVLGLPGVAGRLFGPLGAAYIIATLASLMVALTVTPALASLLVGAHAPKREPPLYRWCKPRYRRFLIRVERYPRATIATATAFMLAGLLLVPFLGTRFIPKLKEGQFIVHVTLAPGASLDQSLAVSRRVTQALEKLPFVRSVATHIGRAPLTHDIFGSNAGELDVDLKPLSGADAAAARDTIRQTLATIPGANFTLKTFLSERIEETLSGHTAAVVVNIFGNDLDMLDTKARQVFGILNSLPGAANVRIAALPNAPTLVARLDENALKRWGVLPLDALDAVRTAYQGDIVGRVYKGIRSYGLSVVLPPAHRADPQTVGNLLLRTPSDTYVPLKQLANIYHAAGRLKILHQGARRVQTVTADVAGGSVSGFVAAARRKIAREVNLPAGAYIEYAGAAEAQAQSQRSLFFNSLIVGVFIVLLLSVVLAQPRNLLLILPNLPFALVGGILAVLALRGVLSMGALIGFVTLFGITLRNGIMLISHYEHLVREEGAAWSVRTALRGAGERLMPILMTALVTGLGLLPLALNRAAPGNAIEGAMAIVILGGLVTSTALNLLLLPTLALRFGRFSAKR